MELDTTIKLAVYRHFVETGRPPSAGEVARRAGTKSQLVIDAYARLRAARVMLLEADGESIRMAPPFSGVPTQHVVESEGVEYFANCAWDALGIPAALHRRAMVRSRCEQSREPFRLRIGIDGPEPSDWLFHCLVPASKWWDDLVFT